ncbi:MAG: peptide deformylase [Gammaproteobacteria bacterium]|nr:MAG: peptide deformylase [Gammaproteobacteria bacterium]
MTILNILEFPDRRLRTVAKKVVNVDSEIKQITADMLETMYDAPGIGLAATQVNIHKRIIVIDLSEQKDQPQVFINPEITILDDAPHEHEEGCLSVPGFSEAVERPAKVSVSALNEKGQAFELVCEDLLATCIQHELDHLNGKLFVDYLSMLKRQRIKIKLQKQHKSQH